MSPDPRDSDDPKLDLPQLGGVEGHQSPTTQLEAGQSSQLEIPNSFSPWWGPFAQPAISGVAALLGALVGGWVARANMSSTNNQRANEMEISQIQAKLDGFYGRFLLISEENKLISLEFKKRQGDEGFRTLIALLDPTWFDGLSKNDQTIVKSIIENGRTLRALVREKAGLVDPSLHPYLAKASAHFSILELAFLKDLENDPDRFRQYVYPKSLDGVLGLEVKRLADRMVLLMNNTDKRHGPLKPLKIPDDLQI